MGITLYAASSVFSINPEFYGFSMLVFRQIKKTQNAISLHCMKTEDQIRSPYEINAFLSEKRNICIHFVLFNYPVSKKCERKQHKIILPQIQLIFNLNFGINIYPI